MEITRAGMKRLLRVFSLFARSACLMLVVHRTPAVAANQGSDTGAHTAPPAAPVRPVTEELSFAKTPHEAILVHVTCYAVSLYVIDFTCALDFGEARQVGITGTISHADKLWDCSAFTD